MDGKLNVNINIEGTPILHFSSFTLEQRFNAHHYFELRFNNDQQGVPGMISLERSRNFIGKSLTIQFDNGNGQQQQFTGKVTKVELSQSHGFHGTVIVSGYSPTVLIDRGPDLGSYLAKDLSAIIRKATEDAPSNDLKMQLNPTRKSPVDYIIQYRESDFEFLNRLSAEYHEWFFYDGQNLNFGKPDKQEEVALTYGRDVHSIQYSMRVAPLKGKRFAYHPKSDQIFEAEAKGNAKGPADLAHAVSASNDLYGRTYSQPLAVRIDNKQEIDTFVDNEDKANSADLLQIMGSGDNPGVGLGRVVNISMSVRDNTDFSISQLGKFLVTSVYHQLDGVGHYTNTFEGITADAERIPIQEYDKPFADMQLATVMENDDPDKQGRIKVQFKWECNCNDATEWLRVVSPNAGNGETGGNRGFFVVPEKGDQVVVAFEEGNIARPMVLGSVFSGKTANSGGFSNSGTKAFNSRKGSTLTFDDKDHFLMLQTDATNQVKIEKSGNKVSITAADQIVFTTGDSSITMLKDGSITIKGKKFVNIEGTTEQVQLHSDKLIDVNGKQKIALGTDCKLIETKATKISSTSDTLHEMNAKTMTMKGDTITDIKGATLNLNC